MPANAWHTLRVEFAGKRIRVALDGKWYIDLEDNHINGAGAVGLWTKADSVTAFDDFSYARRVNSRRATSRILTRRRSLTTIDANARVSRMPDLTGKQRRHLRALGQRLSATVQVGHGGVTDALVVQVDAQLDALELVKVRVGDNAPEDRHDIAEALARRTGAHLAQVLGRTALLYRARREAPEIVLPS